MLTPSWKGGAVHSKQIPQPDAALHTANHLMQYHDLIESIVAAMDARDAYTASTPTG